MESALRALKKVQIAEGETDPRGWDVYSSDGSYAGVVYDLLIDLDRMRASHLIVERQPAEPGKRRRILIPIEAARLVREGQRVTIAGLLAADFDQLREFRPPQKDGPESKVAFLPHHQTPALGGGFYRVPPAKQVPIHGVEVEDKRGGAADAPE